MHLPVDMNTHEVPTSEDSGIPGHRGPQLDVFTPRSTSFQTTHALVYEHPEEVHGRLSFRHPL